MKKILLSILLSAIFITIMPTTLFAENRNEITKEELARSVMQTYMQSRDWNSFAITDVEKVYDANLVEYGYVFELSDSDREGYGIVIEFNNNYIFVEGSVETESPFKNNLGNKNVYTSAFGYFSSPSNLRSVNTLVDLTNNEIIEKNQLVNTRVIVDSVDVSGATSRNARFQGTIYLPSYSAKFNPLVQPNGHACIPTSATMALKYLSNVGKLSLYGSDLTDIAKRMHKAMNSSMSTVNDSQAKAGIENYTSNRSNCSRTVTFGSTYSYTPNVANWNTIKTEIDDEYPALTMFRENIVGYGVTHATTMIGYQQIEIDDYGNTANYTIVRDPGKSSVPELTILWTNSNIYGYFILYLN